MSRQIDIEDAEQWLELCPERVFANWKAAHAVEPFGGEQQLLARIASLLYLIAAKDNKFEKVCEASDALMKFLMPSDWVGLDSQQSEPTDAATIKKNLMAMQAIAQKAFG